MKLNIVNYKGEKTSKELELPESIFGLDVNADLISQYVYVYLSNQREAIAHTKTRADVSGGGRKPHAQKGTGRARAGSNRSPIWRGGGITFGPNKNQNFKKQMSQKMRVGALLSAFSAVAKIENVVVMEKPDFKFGDKPTQLASMVLKNIANNKKFTYVVAEPTAEEFKAFSNLQRANVVRVGELNAYNVIHGGKLIMTPEAVELINSTWVK